MTEKVCRFVRCPPCTLEAKKRGKRFEAKGVELLPGIPDELTLNLIAPKLPWRTFHVLSSASPAWLHAIRSHDVHGARVRSLSTDTYVLINYPTPEDTRGVALYSMSDDTCSKLPQIPYRKGGIPKHCGGVSLDGKFYVLGGRSENPNHYVSSRQVHVFDLAGQRQWKRCANMITQRERFGCGVMDGKIYVFGGESPTTDTSAQMFCGSHTTYPCAQTICDAEVYDGKKNVWSSISPMMKTICDSEVYDPKKNVWSSISPMMKREQYNSSVVATLEEEFVLHTRSPLEDADYYEDTYHPLTDKWTVVKGFRNSHKGLLFHAQGKLHTAYGLNIDVRDANSWIPLHYISFDAVYRDLDAQSAISPALIIAFEDQVLAIMNWVNPEDEIQSWCVSWRSSLVRTRGLGGNNKAMEWKKSNFLPSVECDLTDGVFPFMCPIQL